MKETLAVQAVDNLVSQFSSALDCFRELVQNSIDAGTPQVDVWTEFIRGGEDEDPERLVGEGTVAIHVDDFGEGMDEAIIDDQLTQLFSSSKEDDLTKIGKFGIGFVSVFALKPKAVLVHTGRGGEFWEVLFHADRSFTKTRLDVPVEGTQLTLFVSGDRRRYDELVEGIRATLKRWCRHSEIEVSFEDRSPRSQDAAAFGFGEPERINEPFEVPGDCMTRVQHQGTEIVLAYSWAPSYGFYNKGLALATTRAPVQLLDHRSPRYGHIALKIKSRYLEHTLSRETVLRDENYAKAMRLLDQAADGPLRGALLAELEALCATGTWGLAELTRYRTLLAFLCREPIQGVVHAARRPILRTVAGGALTLEALLDAVGRDGRVFRSVEDSELCRRVAADGVPVLLATPHTDEALRTPSADGPRADAPGGDPVGALVVRYMTHKARSSLLGWLKEDVFGRDLRSEAAARLADPAEIYIAVTLDDPGPAEVRQLVSAAGRILGSVGAGYRKLTSCTLPEASLDPPLFLVAREISDLMALPPRSVDPDDRPRRPEAAVNRDHPQVRALVKLHQTAPELAAYCLAKDLLLHEDRLLERDPKLMTAALRIA